ncbi:MAG: O-antigen ligase family protein [Pseudomonadota bacterium]
MKKNIFRSSSASELVLAAILLMALLLGGSGRDDVTSLVVLRPIAILALAVALCLLPSDVWQRNKALLACAFASVLLVALQLVPLPPAIWQALPGRDLVVEIDRAAGMADVWRPISLVPYRTVNALMAMALPLAVLLLALTIERERQFRIALLLLAGLFASTLFGLLQIIGGEGNAFYLYRITNDGSAVGLFANRNHHAVALAMAFPLTAALVALASRMAEERSGALQWGGLSFAALLLPSLLVAQSRAGILVGLVGLASVLFVLKISPFRIAGSGGRNATWKTALALVMLVAVAILTVQMTASNSFDRLSASGVGTETSLRFNTWPVAVRLAFENLPFGTGMGTFVEAYRVVEPDFMLRPQYMNHAHNDFVELFLTGGLPFVLLLAASLAVVVRNYFRGSAEDRSEVSLMFRRLGAVILLLLFLASSYDYPLRTPLMAAIFALSLVWTAGRAGADRSLNEGT